jgi:hypothetical protein
MIRPKRSMHRKDSWSSFLASQNPAYPGQFGGIPPKWIIENVFDWLLNQKFRVFMFDRFECDQDAWTGYSPASLVWTIQSKCDAATITFRGCREIALGREMNDKYVICDKGEAVYTIGRLVFVPRSVHITSVAPPGVREYI